MSVSTSLATALEQDPGNWSVRIALAEALQSEGNTSDAAAILRENPLSPITEDQSARARQLLDELESVEDGGETAEEEAVLIAEVVDGEEETEPVALAVEDEVDTEPVMVAQIVEDAGTIEEVAEPNESGGEETAAAEAVAALDSFVEEESVAVPEEEEISPAIAKPSNQVGISDLETESDFEDGAPVLFVGDGTAVHVHDKASDTPQKLSAFSVALGVHAIIFLLLTLVSLALPRPNPPAVVATITQPDIDDIIPDVTVKRIARVASSSTSQQPTYTITAVAASDLALPEAENQAAQSFDVTLGAVSGNIGMGMSFESGDMESEVNFFGIRSKGSRIVLVIEAARFMLTDNKGGIPAYDKVKADIAKMLGGLNCLTAFNIVLFEGKKIATYQDELVSASPSNVRMAIEWLYPINRKFEELGIREDYKSNPLREGIEPIPVTDLTHYIKATQRAMEMDVNTMFLLTSGWVHLHKPLDEEEKERFYRQHNWGEKEEAEWAKAVQRAQAWLQKENEARLKKGVPRRVIRSWHEIVAELEPNLPRKPGPGYTMEEVEDQVKESANAYYRALDKKRPELNVVWFIGEDEEPSITVDTHFKSLTRANRGKMRVLQGLEGLKNVTGDPE